MSDWMDLVIATRVGVLEGASFRGGWEMYKENGVGSSLLSDT